MGSSGINTELTVRINNELSALILRQTLLLDGCVFACETSCICRLVTDRLKKTL